MNRRLFRIVLTTVLLFCLSITSYGITAHVGASGESVSVTATQDEFKYTSSGAYGLRLTAFERETNKKVGTTVSILNHDPQSDYRANTDWQKTTSKTWSETTLHYRVESQVPDPISTNAKDWVVADEHLPVLLEWVGLSNDEWLTGKYVIGVEPIQECYIGSTEYTVIGTATDIAAYVLYGFVEEANTKIVKDVEATINDYARDLDNQGLPYTEKYQKLEEYRVKVIKAARDAFYTSETANILIRGYMGNLTHHDLPFACYLDVDSPEDPDLGFSRVSYSSSCISDASSIIRNGYGIMTIFIEEGGCPHNGPWLGETADEIVWHPIGTYPNYTNKDDAPSRWNKNEVDSSLPAHGTEEAIAQGCICPPKEPPKQVIIPVDNNPIQKDYLNRVYATSAYDASHGSGCYSGHGGSSGGGIASNGTDYTELNDCLEDTMEIKFIGNRGFTGPEELTVSQSYQFNPIPELRNILGLKYEYSKDHVEKQRKQVTATFNTIYDETGGSCSGHTETDDDGGSWTWYCDCVTLSDAPDSVSYTAERTHYAKSKTTDDGLPTKRKVQYTNGSKTVVWLPLDSTQTYTYYPSYKMKYYPNTKDPAREAWMLASGTRTFVTTPMLKITASHSNLTVVSPWSRDYEDVQQSYDVTKAGNAIKVDGTTIDYDMELTYFIHDEYYLDGVKRDYKVNQEYKNLMIDIGNQISKLHLMSNVPYTGDYEGLIVNNLGIVNRQPSDILKKSLIIGNWNSTTNWAGDIKVYVERSNFDGSDTTSRVASTVDGKIIGAATKFTEISPAIIKSPSGQEWYVEDYEGFIKVTMKTSFKVNPPKDVWFEIFRDISDWKSTYNTIRNPITLPVENLAIYNGTNFVIGYGNHVPTTTVPSSIYRTGGSRVQGPDTYKEVSFNNIIVPNSLFQFMIRGSAYDQH